MMQWHELDESWMISALPFSLSCAAGHRYSMAVQWSKVAIIGMGLLGGSLGLALKKRALAGSVVGFVRRPASVTDCQRMGVSDAIELDLGRAISGADLVVLCTPVAQMRPLAEQMASHLKRDAIVTDVGSVKERVVRDLEPAIASAGASFIGSHPMAGSEKTGVTEARSDLFVNAICVVTPGRSSEPEQIAQLEEFWTAVGGIPMRLSPGLHDELVSRSSHLPHILAAMLADFVLSPDHPREQPQLCASGFRDTTRIAAGSPEMWRDICIANRENLGRALGIFIERLQEFRRALDQQDANAIDELLTRAKARRDAWRGPNDSSTTE
jgi:prephenate dehydrogenase